MPIIVLHGNYAPVSLPASGENQEQCFTNFYERRAFENVGHFPPRECPEAFVEAILGLTKSEGRAMNKSV